MMATSYSDQINGLGGSPSSSASITSGGQGIAYKAPCRVATTGNITLSGTQTIDGVAVVAGDRVLVRAQTNQIDNGIWLVSSGTWTRAPDFDSNRDITKGTRVTITDGSTLSAKEYMISSDNPISIGTDNITFTETLSSDAGSSAAAAAASAGAALTSQTNAGNSATAAAGSASSASTSASNAATSASTASTAATNAGNSATSASNSASAASTSETNAGNSATAAATSATNAATSASDAAASAASINPANLVHIADTDASGFGFVNAAGLLADSGSTLAVESVVKAYVDAAISAIREKLTANRTYYVRADGSDSNTGLVNNSGGAFLTLQKAINVATLSLDLAGFAVTIQVGDGTYTAGVTMTNRALGGTVTIQGNAGTPANVVVSVTSATCFLVGEGAILTVKNLKVQTTTAGDGMAAYNGGAIYFQNIDFGACASFHIEAFNNGRVMGTGNYSITGGATAHLHAYNIGFISLVGGTVTLTGTPAFGAWFAGASFSNIAIASLTFSGSATGARYLAHKNSLIDTSGGGATFLPGNAAGSTATGGQYL